MSTVLSIPPSVRIPWAFQATIWKVVIATNIYSEYVIVKKMGKS